MCLSNSVGKKGANRHDDVKTVQVLLNINLGKLIPLRPVDTDGRIGSGTIGAIEEFQRRVMGMKDPDGRVDPKGKTLNQLRDGIPSQLTEDMLQGIMIHASEDLVTRYFAPLTKKMADNGISSPLQQAHFLAQLAHESGEFRYAEEIASGAAYEGRADLGNTEPGDGRRFKGRGLMQLTGRANYKAYGDARGGDYTSDATAGLIASDPYLAVDVSCWFWTEHDLNQKADTDDVSAVTRTINGGYNGLDDRKAKLARAKFFLLP